MGQLGIKKGAIFGGLGVRKMGYSTVPRFRLNTWTAVELLQLPAQRSRTISRILFARRCTADYFRRLLRTYLFARY